MKKIFFAVLLFVSAKAFAQGNTGIGTTAPHSTATLQVDIGASQSKGLLVTGVSSGPNTVPNLGAGTRFMFYPGRAAIRAGLVYGNQWDNANVGFSSAAFGNNVVAKGYASFATGFNSYAQGDYSFAHGAFLTAKGFASTVVGMYNDSLLATDEVSVQSATPLFMVGNGSSAASSNAFVVRKDGNVGIGNFPPDFRLDVGNRMRIRGGGDEFSSPGIWLNKVDNSGTAAFIGILNDNSVGLWGDLGAGWNFVMNTVSGNIGIGNLAPANKLDVNGNVNLTGLLKINNSSGTAGQILVSNGTSAPTWQNQPAANPQTGFFATQLNDQNIPSGFSETVLTNYTESFDDGNSFNPATGVFTAATAGLYHFDTKFAFSANPVGEFTVICYLKVNGNNRNFYQSHLTQYINTGFTYNVKLAAGNTVSLAAQHFNASTAIATDASSVLFSGYKVY